MNDTHSMDHLQVINHVTTMLTAVQAGGAVAAKPKTATTHHFDATGKDVAHISSTSYEGVTFAADGSINGGSLSHQSVNPGGFPLTTTSIGFGASGKPASANIDVHNLHSDGLFKKVAMDMSAATWNEAFAVSSGQVNVTATHPLTGAKMHDGTIQFDKESLVSGSFTHYDHLNGGAVSGHSQVDYSGAKFIGTSLVGGQYAIHSLNPDKSLAATSTVAVSPLGRIDSIETANMGSAAEIKTKVKVDFTKGSYNALNRFHEGDLLYNVTDDKGAKLSDTTVTYQNAVPSVSQTQVYGEGGALNGKIAIDYSQSQFNNNNQVVNSTKKVDVYGSDNQLVSSSMVAYDQNGNKMKAMAGATPAFQPVKPPVAVQAAEQLQATIQAVLQQSFIGLLEQHANTKIETTNRPDGTRLQQRTTFLSSDGKPIGITITNFGLDGNTIVRTHQVFLNNLNYDDTAKTVSGALDMQSLKGDNTVQAKSSVQY